ncbi:MAG: T9SS C-terminal target domain-containing protein, partial [Gemmatimonadetes bacterium]
YELPNPSHLSIRIYDVMGRLITTLVNEDKEAGRHTVIWNGRNDKQQPVPSGIYVYRMTNEFGLSLNNRMILLR